VVALAALLVAVENGNHGALMAPTEVLAEQHFAVLTEMLAGLTVAAGEQTLFEDRPVRVALLTNRTSAAERRRLASELEMGQIDIVVGTHALIYGDVPFPCLGLVVIDEQHRFGVEQRAVLKDREPPPDTLVMTATPIPRTAGMLIYGDLDKSELRELPGGRRPITTVWVDERENFAGLATDGVLGSVHSGGVAYAAVRDQVAAGRQAYVVCPLVEGSSRVEAKAATEEFERLRVQELKGLRLGLLHGQMKSDDKQAIMRDFRAGTIDVLVTTTVIEVGVDVANATVMVIEDADRFGLLQLHQLRGRIGRGSEASTCYLVAAPTTTDGVARLEAMVESTDGFVLAERDLEIRGMGEVFGERQAGMGDLKLGRLPRDTKYVDAARDAAVLVLDSDPRLEAHPQLREEVEDLLGDDVDYLFKS
jgi:ATP-dependent DNA helicase RecG